MTSPDLSRPVLARRLILPALLLGCFAAAPALSQTPTQTTLEQSSATSRPGQPVSLTATVDAQGQPAASGRISFRDGETEFALATLSAMGIGVSDVSAGAQHSCALANEGRVFCWGSGRSFRLGRGRNQASSPVPVQVSNLADAVSLGAGSAHNCAVLQSGAVQCWGHGTSGQLGNGSTQNRYEPEDVLDITDATRVSAGLSHSCALLASGGVRCWGSGERGRLGNGGTARSSVPVPVSGITDAVSLSVGTIHSCAVLENGSVQCWGDGSQGRMGTGSRLENIAVTEPVQVSGITNAISVSVGHVHSCALLQNGALQCWGRGLHGQLGSGDTADVLAPVPVRNINTARRVTAGTEHSCALLQGGTVQCWGRGYLGRLGNGSIDDMAVTVPRSVPNINDAVSVTAGGAHSCVALESGAVQCFGSSFYGQLGYGGTDDSPVPVTVRDLSLRSSATAEITVSDLPLGTRELSAVFSGGDGLAGSIGTASHTVLGTDAGFSGGGAVFASSDACGPALGRRAHGVTIHYSPAELNGVPSELTLAWPEGSEHLALWGAMAPSGDFLGAAGRQSWSRFVFYPTRPRMRVVSRQVTRPPGAALAQAEEVVLRLRAQNFAAIPGCVVTIAATLRQG